MIKIKQRVQVHPEEHSVNKDAVGMTEALKLRFMLDDDGRPKNPTAQLSLSNLGARERLRDFRLNDLDSVLDNVSKIKPDTGHLLDMAKLLGSFIINVVYVPFNLAMLLIEPDTSPIHILALSVFEVCVVAWVVISLAKTGMTYARERALQQRELGFACPINEGRTISFGAEVINWLSAYSSLKLLTSHLYFDDMKLWIRIHFPTEWQKIAVYVIAPLGIVIGLAVGLLALYVKIASVGFVATAPLQDWGIAQVVNFLGVANNIVKLGSVVRSASVDVFFFLFARDGTLQDLDLEEASTIHNSLVGSMLTNHSFFVRSLAVCTLKPPDYQKLLVYNPLGDGEHPKVSKEGSANSEWPQHCRREGQPHCTRFALPPEVVCAKCKREGTEAALPQSV